MPGVSTTIFSAQANFPADSTSESSLMEIPLSHLPHNVIMISPATTYFNNISVPPTFPLPGLADTSTNNCQNEGLQVPIINGRGENFDVVHSIHISYLRFLDKNKYVCACAIFVIIVAMAYYGIQVFDNLSDGGFEAPNSESAITNRYFSSRFISPDPDLIITMYHPQWLASDFSFKFEYLKIKACVLELVPDAFGFYSFFDYPTLGSSEVSVDGHFTVVFARLPLNYKVNTLVRLADFQFCSQNSPLDVGWAGGMLAIDEISSNLGNDLLKIEEKTIPILIVVMIFAFEGAVAAVIPLVLVVWTIIASLVCLNLVTTGFSVTSYVTNVTTVFGAGLAIDFTLFIHLRFSEEMNKHKDDPPGSFTIVDALEIAIKTSGRTVCFSGCLLCATLSGGIMFSEYYLTTMTLSIMFPAILAAIGTIIIVPVVYLLLGHWVFYGSTKPTTTWAMNHVKKIYGLVD